MNDEIVNHNITSSAAETVAVMLEDIIETGDETCATNDIISKLHIINSTAEK